MTINTLTKQPTNDVAKLADMFSAMVAYHTVVADLASRWHGRLRYPAGIRHTELHAFSPSRQIEE